MRKVLLSVFVILGLLFAFGIVNTDVVNNPRRLIYYTPCEEPLGYKIGEIDPRFGISTEELKDSVSRAEQIWEGRYGENLFEYNPQAVLSISMVYDERQSLNQKIGALENKISQDKSEVETRIQEFDRRSAEFKRKLADFNAQVEYWNSQGGAPKEEYDKLKSQQEELKKESEELSAMAKSLNKSASEFNDEVGKLNNTVETFNGALKARPEQGLYDSLNDTISIYITSNNQELVHTIAHELGHALGMDHVEDEAAIMYTSTNSSIIPSSADLRQLAYVCRERTTIEGLRDTIIFSIQKWKAQQMQSN